MLTESMLENLTKLRDELLKIYQNTTNKQQTKTYKTANNESSKHSNDIVKRTIALIQEIIDNEKSYFPSLYFNDSNTTNKIIDLFLDYDNKLGTMVPAVYNLQTLDFAKAARTFLQSIDVEKDFSWQMNFAFSAGKPKVEINRLQKRLEDKIRQFEISLSPKAKLLREDYITTYSNNIEENIKKEIKSKADFDTINNKYKKIVEENIAKINKTKLPHYLILRSGLISGYTKVNEVVKPLFLQTPPGFDKEYLSCKCIMDTPFVNMFNIEKDLNTLLQQNGYRNDQILNHVRESVKQTSKPQKVQHVNTELTNFITHLANKMEKYITSKPHAIKVKHASNILYYLSNPITIKPVKATTGPHQTTLIENFKNEFKGSSQLTILIVETTNKAGQPQYTVAGYNNSGKIFTVAKITDENDHSGKLRTELAAKQPREEELLHRTKNIVRIQPPETIVTIALADAFFAKCGFLYKTLQNALIMHHRHVTNHNLTAGFGQAISLGRFNDFMDEYINELLDIVAKVDLSNSPGMAYQLQIHKQYPQEIATAKEQLDERTITTTTCTT